MSPFIGLWPERLIFIGRLGYVAPHRHAAVVCLVAVEGELQVRMAGESDWRTCLTATIPAGALHELELRDGLTAVLYNDADRPFHPLLSAVAARAPAFAVPHAGALRQALRRFVADRNPGALERALADSLGTYEQSPARDSRIRDTIARTHADLAESHSLADLAAACALSPGRLQHLFLDEIGVPLRRFRIWLRFRNALERIAAGESFTEAALAAGFAGSPHFSHAFKAMFGVAPASVIADRLGLVVRRFPDCRQEPE